ncbi:serine/threonine-protein kinase [Sphaerisporangium sp. TRM90804]|uniref:serine/threonine-protein kinase n=1 Tax=Sphaerisporangium sp. TRM90804 TaxID=3031113 RepID=UPI0024468875|nr:serine/threonine-protein kinase [Sphaerisporangium sp. TRM90804]MDH2427660.1 protein kinase [Sphaerisporangium sp. TRM90804]
MTGDTVPDTLRELGPYRLLRRLGEGGMGVVHLGLDEEGREVAVKVLHRHVAADLKARDRLTREVETMRRVRSPRVAQVLDAKLTGSTPYIVTRFAPGRTLEETVLTDGPLPANDVIRLVRGLSEALIAIHAADVVHRDLKPANVMIVDGDPLVIDFGIAHLVNATRLTQTGMFVGTPGYLAPEIIRDEEITQAADVHALAATVFFGATGKPPFGTGSFEMVCYNIMEGRASIDKAPAWLRPWLRAALNVNPGARPNAQGLLAMARGLDASVTSQLPPPPNQGGQTRRLDAPHGNGRVPDGTRAGAGDSGPDRTHVLNGAAAPPGDLPPTRRTKPVSEDSYSDILPPVLYAEPERRRRADAQRSQPAAFAPPPAYQPGPGEPAAPYGQPPGRYPPAPYADQRVAGYPPPPPSGPPQGVAGPPANARPYAPDQEHRPPAPDRPRYRAGHPVLAALLLVVAVAGARMLPVLVGTLMVVVVLCLRVGEYLWADLAQRRSIRGNSASDPLLLVLGTPWALLKAGLMTLVVTPLAGMFALCVWGVLYYLAGFNGSSSGADTAAAYAAAAFVAGLFVLPGGGPPRKAVARTLTAVIRSPGAGMVVTIIVGTVAFLAVVTAMNAVPSWVPWRPPSEAISALSRSARDSVTGLLGGLAQDLLGKHGFGFFTFGR